MSTSPCRKAYDHRLRDITCEEGDPTLFRDLGVPRSTAASWIRRGQRPVVSAQLLALDQRVPDAAAKRSILDAVAHATKAIPLAVALRVLRLSAARYHEWNKRPQDCSLDDRTSCPRTSPTQLTTKEISDIKDMVVSQKYRHMGIRSLALRAQRIGRVFVSPSTWRRLIEHKTFKRHFSFAGWAFPQKKCPTSRIALPSQKQPLYPSTRMAGSKLSGNVAATTKVHLIRRLAREGR